jgi:hypothetical protein
MMLMNVNDVNNMNDLNCKNIQNRHFGMHPKDASRFRAMTGYDVPEFNELLSYFEDAHNEYLTSHYLNGKPRELRRAHVIYSNSPLPCIEERLAFILSYRKLNPLQELQADLFGMTQKQCCLFFHGLDHILHLALERADVVPAQTDRQLQERLSAMEETEADK